MGPPAFVRRPGFTPVESHPWLNISIIAAIPGQCGRNSIEDFRMLVRRGSLTPAVRPFVRRGSLTRRPTFCSARVSDPPSGRRKVFDAKVGPSLRPGQRHPACVSLRRRQNTHRYLRPPIFPGRECLAETFFASSPCPAAASAARTLLSWHADPLYTDVMSETATLDTESEILEQVIESDTAGMSPEAAQALLRFRFNTAAVARMNELAEKNRQGTIAPSERALLERYLRVGNFLNLIHAKARCALAEPASPAS